MISEGTVLFHYHFKTKSLQVVTPSKSTVWLSVTRHDKSLRRWTILLYSSWQSWHNSHTLHTYTEGKGARISTDVSAILTQAFSEPPQLFRYLQIGHDW